MFYQTEQEVKSKLNKKSLLLSIIGIFVVLILLLLIFLIPAFNQSLATVQAAEYGQYRVINDNTKLWKDSTLDGSDILDTLAKDTVVIVLEGEDAENYYKVRVNEKEGYLRIFDIAKVTEITTQYQVIQVKATTKKLGDKIKIYVEPSEDSAVAKEVRDGQRLQVVDEGIPNFYSVIYDEKTYYVSKSNVTTKLSQSQLTALIVSLVSASTILIVFSIIYLNKNLQNRRTYKNYMNRE
ncbi:MAG: hypothetical protein ACOX24_06910 [Christensenellales bacterium]|jgi:uncharacterized protein YgiM (DUF1202 family)